MVLAGQGKTRQGRAISPAVYLSGPEHSWVRTGRWAGRRWTGRLVGAMDSFLTFAQSTRAAGAGDGRGRAGRGRGRCPVVAGLAVAITPQLRNRTMFAGLGSRDRGGFEASEGRGRVEGQRQRQRQRARDVDVSEGEWAVGRVCEVKEGAGCAHEMSFFLLPQLAEQDGRSRGMRRHVETNAAPVALHTTHPATP